MQTNRMLQRYHQMQVETSDPLSLILLAYDGILVSLNKALEMDRAGDYEGKCREIQRTLDLVNELWASLDMERGGEIARSLSSIYRFITSQILTAEARGDESILATIRALIQELRDGWEQLRRQSPVEMERKTPENDPVRFPTAVRL